MPSWAIVFVAVALSILEFRASRSNIGAGWNGYGAIKRTCAKSSHAPMRYRALVPWMIGWLPCKMQVWAYLAVKALLLLTTLALAEYVLGAALPLAILLACTYEFDYWDNYAELIGILCCLSGNHLLIALGSIMWGLSRETAILSLPLAWATSGTLWGGLGIVAVGVVRLIQGKAKLYCPRWTWRVYNWPDLQVCWSRQDWAIYWSAIWSVAVLVSMWFLPPGVLRATAWAVPVLLIAGWAMGRARETRIFLPTALWLIATWQ